MVRSLQTVRSFRIIVAAFAATMLFSGSATAETHTVVITGFVFNPQKIEIKAGDTVTWRNDDIVPHTATANNRLWDTGEIPAGAEKSLTFTTAYSGEYFCVYHPSMKADMNVLID